MMSLQEMAQHNEWLAWWLKEDERIGQYGKRLKERERLVFILWLAGMVSLPAFYFLGRLICYFQR